MKKKLVAHFVAAAALIMIAGCVSGGASAAPVEFQQAGEHESILTMSGNVAIIQLDGKEEEIGITKFLQSGLAGHEWIGPIPTGPHNMVMKYTRSIDQYAHKVSVNKEISHGFLPGRSYRVSGWTEVKSEILTSKIDLVSISDIRLRILDATDESLYRIQNRKVMKIPTLYLGFRLNPITFSPDSSMIAYIDVTDIDICNAADGTLIKTIFGHKKEVVSVWFSADGRHIFSFALDNTVKQWDVGQGTEIKTISVGKANVTAYSPVANRIAAAVGKNIEVYDTDTGQKLTTFSAHKQRVHDMWFSPDGSTIISVSDPGMNYRKTDVLLWEAGSGKQISSVTLDFALYAAGWHPSGEHIAVGFFQDASSGGIGRGAAPMITILDGKTLDKQKEFDAFGEKVLTLSYSPDGTKILCVTSEESVSTINNAILLDAETGTELRVFTTNTNKAAIFYGGWNPAGTQVAFSTTRRRFDDTTIPNCYQIWDAGVNVHTPAPSADNSEIGNDTGKEL